LVDECHEQYAGTHQNGYFVVVHVVSLPLTAPDYLMIFGSDTITFAVQIIKYPALQFF